MRDLRKSIGIVFEDTFLFSDTVRENIAFADPEASTERVRRAARLAGAEAFIDALPDGYDTVIGEHGFSLSGGQRQRIAIARAVIADPKVLILDDATSSVDPTKEHEIRSALGEVMDGRTTIIIAHRPATIALADRVVLLADGVVVAEGTHEELLATSDALPHGARGRGELAGPGRGRRSAGMRGGWVEGGPVDEDSKLDREPGAPGHAPAVADAAAVPQADRARVVRARRCRPRACSPGPRSSATASTPGCSTATATRSNLAALAFLVVAVLGLVDRPLGDLAGEPDRRAVPAGAARAGVQAPHGPVDGLLRAGEDRPARVAHDVGHRRAPGAHLAGARDVHPEHPDLRRRDRRDLHHELAARALRARHRAAGAHRQPLVPARVEPRVPRGARDASARTSPRCRRGSRACASCRRSGASGAGSAGSTSTNEAQYEANLETVRISAKYFPFVEFTGVLGIAIVVGMGGLFVDQGIVTVGTVLAFVLYLNSLFEPIQQLSQLYNTVQSAGAALHKVFGLLDTEGTVAREARRGRPARPRRDRGRRRVVRVRRRPARHRRCVASASARWCSATCR